MKIKAILTILLPGVIAFSSISILKADSVLAPEDLLTHTIEISPRVSQELTRTTNAGIAGAGAGGWVYGGAKFINDSIFTESFWKNSGQILQQTFIETCKGGTRGMALGVGLFFVVTVVKEAREDNNPFC